MKQLLTLFILMLAVIGMNAQDFETLYIIGNDPFGNWNPSVGMQMNKNDDGMFELTVEIPSSCDFRFSRVLASDSNGWDEINPYSMAPMSNITITENLNGAVIQCSNWGKNVNNVFRTTMTAIYTILVDPWACQMMMTWEGGVTPQSATGITLSQTTASIAIGSTLQLTATVSPSTANQVVTWSSSNPSVATVSSSGLVTPKSVGSAIITATTSDGTNLSASCQVTVKQLATGISLNKTSATLNNGETLQLTATVTPSNTSNKAVTWTSSNTSVATVNNSGLVTTKGPGSATITATTQDGSNLSASCQVTVKQLATGISLSQTTASIIVNNTLQLTATVSPDNTTNKAVTWSSSNTNIATVSSSGLVTAKAVGSATITVTTADGSNKSATCQITVTPQLATSVTINKTSASLVVGKTLQLTATVLPSNANQDVTWSSDNSSIATVSTNGLVTAKAVGTATITVTTTDGSNKSATCQITVTPQLATGITLDKTTAEIGVGGSITLVATVSPENAENKNVVWSSSNTNVATVVRGVVRGITEGECIITVTTVDGSNLSASCFVTVTQTTQLATSVTLDRSSASIVVDKTMQLTATVNPNNTTDKSVTWSTSNSAVATVSNTGLVKAVAVGTATITVTTADGSNKSATCQITVTPQLATGITLDKTSSEIGVGGSITLVATVTPENADNNVIWESSNPSVATVIRGVVKGVAEGECIIKATTIDGSNLSASCFVTVTQTQTTQLATSVTLDRTSANIVLNKTLQLTATVNPNNTTDKSVTWSSSNTNIATVTGTGLVTAVAVGTATITVTTADGSNKSATCQVTVTPQLATGITLDKSSAEIGVGGNITLVATVTPNNTENKNVVWNSSNPNIATVVRGVVKGVAEGECMITATTVDGSNLSASCFVTVTATTQLATGITLDQTAASVVIDKTLQLTATVTPSNTSDKSVTWKSSNTNVATVNDVGLVTAVAIGTATITVTTADGSNKSATCQVTVTPQLATGITLDRTTASIVVDNTLKIYATVTPSNTTNKNVAWSSSNTSVATVSSTGRITAKAVGTAVITATTKDGSNLSADCQVTVTPQLVTGITLDKSTAEVGIGETITLVATVTPENAANKNLMWNSSNPSIATVVKGAVKGVAVGECMITATTTDGSNLSAQCIVTVTEQSTQLGDNYMSANDVPQIVRGQVLTLPIALTNQDQIAGFQADLYLPSGFEPSLDNNDQFVFLESSRRNGHTIRATVNAVATRIAASSIGNAAFKGNSGTLFYIKLKVDDNLVNGLYGIDLKNIILTTPGGGAIEAPNVKINVGVDAYHNGDANGDGFIDDADYEITANYIMALGPSNFIFNAADMDGDGRVLINDLPLIVNQIKTFDFNSNSNAPAIAQAPSRAAANNRLYISNFEMEGGKTGSVYIKMKNTTEFVAAQCDIRLPSGMSLVKQGDDDNGEPIYSTLIDTRMDGHQLNSCISPTGDLRVIITNGQNKAIKNTSGALAKFKVKTAANFAGEHTILIHNIVCVDKDSNAGRYALSDAVVYVNQGASIPGDIDGNGEVNGTDLNILINIVLGKDQAANYGGRADIDAGGTVDGSDLNALINILLGK